MILIESLITLFMYTQESALDAWWNCRNFVLNDDLALDYDIGGLAVSLTFLLNVCSMFVLIYHVSLFLSMKHLQYNFMTFGTSVDVSLRVQENV